MIGSQVSRTLLSRGQQVVAIDAVTPDKGPKLKEWRIQALETQDGFTLHRQDIRDPEGLATVFGEHDIDAVINLAALAGVRESTLRPEPYLQTNVYGTLNLLELCREHDVNQFVLASTSSIYGHHNDVPFSEDAPTEVPSSPYAASKKSAEAYAATYNDLYGINVAVPRFFTVYGPAGRPDMAVFRFIRWVAEGEPITVYGDGTQKRDFTYVDDIARGTVACLNVDGYEVVNLGNDSPVSVNELIELIEKHVGREAEVSYEKSHATDMDATWADISKARRLLGWEPQVSLDEGVRRTVEWYMENRELARSVDLGKV